MRARRLASEDSPDVSHVSYGTIKIFDGATDQIASIFSCHTFSFDDLGMPLPGGDNSILRSVGPGLSAFQWIHRRLEAGLSISDFCDRGFLRG